MLKLFCDGLMMIGFVAAVTVIVANFVKVRRTASMDISLDMEVALVVIALLMSPLAGVKAMSYSLIVLIELIIFDNYNLKKRKDDRNDK